MKTLQKLNPREKFQIYGIFKFKCVLLSPHWNTSIIRAPPSKMQEPYSNHSVRLSVHLSVCPSTLCCNVISQKDINKLSENYPCQSGRQFISSYLALPVTVS